MACSCATPPGIKAEQPRLKTLGGTWLGSCGDENHKEGFHMPPCAIKAGDYSLRYGRGGEHYSAAMDVGMNFTGSRQWLAWLVNEVRAGRIKGVVEIIGSLDGKTVNYWAKWHNWETRKYTGAGHVKHTHVGYDRTKTGTDWHVLDWKRPSSPQKTWTETIVEQLPTLRKGMKGSAVGRLQALLQAAGYDSLKRDDDFGALTEVSVRAFQKKATPYDVDGVVGKATWTKLLGL